MGSVSILEAISPVPLVRLYGDTITDFSLGDTVLTALDVRATGTEMPQFALIRAFRIGSLCRRLPIPSVLAVYGESTAPDPSDDCGEGSSAVWTLPFDVKSATLDIEGGTLGDLLEDLEDKGISGGIKFEDVRYENGRIKGRIKIWAKIKLPPLGTAKVNESFGFSIPVGGCHTVYDVGIAKVKLCFKAPNRICAALCVGKWGLSKCWDECVTVRLPSGMRGLDDSADEPAKDCDCLPVD
jgi:hypothetical protein